MLLRPRVQHRVLRALAERLEFARDDVARMVAVLQDATAEVWTISPSDSVPLGNGKTQRYSVLGWRDHFVAEKQMLVNALDTYDIQWRQVYAEDIPVADGYRQSIPNVIQACNQLLAANTDANGILTQRLVPNAQRTQLANALNAEVEP